LILKGLRDRYEAHHGVAFTDAALEAAVVMSQRYIQDRFLPDKAIDLIDEAGSKVRLKSFITPTNVKKIRSRVGTNPSRKRCGCSRSRIRKSS
ncbi:Clp protease ATP-binding subunit, partial [Brochothrix campestris FSL F6-1037]